MTLIRDKIIVGHNLWQFLSASDATFLGYEVADHRGILRVHDLGPVHQPPDGRHTRRRCLCSIPQRPWVWGYYASIAHPRPAFDGSQHGPGIRTSGQSAYLIFLTVPRIREMTQQQLENARAALDLYRSAQHPWESAIDSGSWPCALPPVGYAEYFL
jgi:hypothetical protein